MVEWEGETLIRRRQKRVIVQLAFRGMRTMACTWEHFSSHQNVHTCRLSTTLKHSCYPKSHLNGPKNF